jgi:hypothetical protein
VGEVNGIHVIYKVLLRKEDTFEFDFEGQRVVASVIAA